MSNDLSIGNEDRQYLTIEDAADRLGLSAVTVRRQIKAGLLPAELRVGPHGDQYFIAASVVESRQPVTREDLFNLLAAIHNTENLAWREAEKRFEIQFNRLLDRFTETEKLVREQANLMRQDATDAIRRDVEVRRHELQELKQQIQPRRWWMFWQRDKPPLSQ